MKLHRLTGKIGINAQGTASFGCFWEKGQVSSDTCFSCTNDRGEMIPLQSRVLAFWPDGSVKWTGNTILNKDATENITIEVSDRLPVREHNLVSRQQAGQAEYIIVDNGMVQVFIPVNGETLFEKIVKKDRMIAENARPVLILEEPIVSGGYKGVIEKPYEGHMDTTEVEIDGELQTVIKFTGTHINRDNDRKCQFIIRMYINYGEASVRFEHTFIYDGDEKRDFLKGIGISFDRKLAGEVYNRHVKCTLDNGVFHETSALLMSWRPRVPQGIYEDQISGKELSLKGQEKAIVDKVLEDLPLWDAFDVCQDSSTHYLIKKKLAGEDLIYIPCVNGQRTDAGFAFGSEDGSAFVCIKDFWEKYPSGITLSGLSGDKASCTAWFYSPSASSFDYRHYANRGYNQVCYEGYDYKGADPYGIAVTNEVSLAFFDEMIISDIAIKDYTEGVKSPTVFFGDPEFYHDHRAFGYWSLPKSDTETEKWLEDQLDKAFEFYKNETEQRDYYGLYDYGDFMHTYDPVRHVWKYDVGGYAWDNTELVPTLWIWLYFLRTGREDVFRFGEKLIKHASETDVYHIGKYKGMGSRHNVRHWGCPCKEARIAMAGHSRYYYFLTGDLRLEDIFDELKDNEQTFLNRDPLGDFYDKAEMVFPSHARSGPDWSSLCSNWMMEWERKNDPKYLEKIEIGTEDIYNTPLKLSSGPDFEFDPNTLHLRYIGERTTGGQHLQICMGAPSVWMEMADLMESSKWVEMLNAHGRFYFLSHERQLEESGGIIGKRECTLPMFATGLGAYAARNLKDKELAKNVWRILLNSLMTENNHKGFETNCISGYADNSTINEIPWISTNFVAQFCLNVIMTLDLIGDELPRTLDEADKLIKDIPDGKYFRLS